MTNKIPRRSPEQRIAARLARIADVERSRMPTEPDPRGWADKSADEILADIQAYRVQARRDYRQAGLQGWSTLTGEHSHHRTS